MSLIIFFANQPPETLSMRNADRFARAIPDPFGVFGEFTLRLRRQANSTAS